MTSEQVDPSVALRLLDWLWDERPGLVCLATDHRLRDIKSERKPSDFRNAAWYSWPQDRDKVPAYAEMVMGSREVWFTPALLNTEHRRANNATDNGRVCQVDADHTDEWTDEDRATRLALLDKLNAAVVRSGTSGNFHAYVKLDRDTPRGVIDRLNAQLTAAFAGDPTKENASSVLRLPGTLNHKTDPANPVVLEYVDPEFEGWDPDELSAMLPEPAPKGGAHAGAGSSPAQYEGSVEQRLEAAVAELLPMKPSEGIGRDNQMAKVAGYAARVIDSEAVFEWFLRWVNSRMAYQLTDAEVAKKVGIWRREKAKRDEESTEDKLGAQLLRGDVDPAEVVRSWDGYREKVFNDVAGWVIRDDAFDLYYGHLAALAERDPEAFDQTPYARAELVRQIARVRGEERAKILAAGGNTELGEPDDWDETETVERDFTGPGLFVQPGWLSLVIGDYESAKTMVLLWAAAERLRRGETVILIDEESPKDQTFDKLSAFQLTPEQRAGFKRYGHRGWNLAAHPEMLDKLIEKHPDATLVIADSVSRLMSNSGLEDDNAGAMRLWTNIEQFVSRRPGVAFCLIDHQGMGGGLHARGASVKVQQSSIAVRLSMKRKFTKTEDGQLTATVLKHRNGLSTGHEFQVDVTTTGHGPLEMHWTDLGTDPDSGNAKQGQRGADDLGPVEMGILKTAKPTLGVADKWVSKNELDRAADRHSSTVTRAVKKLIDGGYLIEKPGWTSGDGPKQYRRVK
ncbi:AAA family ATPase [Nocardiopsis sp. B62]|uniref:AAA family ATPase n=1 Tax=Nocardiopsis sp. B62 TaxID=2824874 RepID=UPI001B358F64|nr:AAA family ATPase [Nocardiopsis sp. B62]MBQ1081574.1 AAA family ATPase [Nocardiopsis sp. B62]